MQSKHIHLFEGLFAIIFIFFISISLSSILARYWVIALFSLYSYMLLRHWYDLFGGLLLAFVILFAYVLFFIPDQFVQYIVAYISVSSLILALYYYMLTASRERQYEHVLTTANKDNALLHALIDYELEISLEGKIIVDDRDRILVVNKMAERLLHITAQHFSDGKSLLMGIAPHIVNIDDLQVVVDNCYKNREYSVTNEIMEYVDSDGLSTIIQYSTQSVFLGGSRIVRIWLLTDKTAEQQTQAALTATELRYKQLFERAPMSIFIVKTGLTENTILLANPHACDMYGYSVNELIGADMRMLLPPNIIKIQMLMQRARLQGKPVPNSYASYGLRKNGVTFPIYFYISEIPFEDEVIIEEDIILLVFIQDISKQVEMQKRELQQVEKLQSKKSLELLGTMAGGVAHDFNNLLMALSGTISLFEQFEQLTPKGAKGLAKMYDIIHRGKKLTGDLLNYAGGKVASKQYVAINPELEQFKSILQASVRENTMIQYELSADSLQIFVDSGQIQQIIHNLVINASDAIPPNRDGHIHIRSQKVTHADAVDLWAAADFAITNFEYPEYAQLMITDNGTGISKEKISDLFEPFISTKGANRGMGLTIVLSLLEKNNGNIAVHSEENKGTTFQIFLPICTQHSISNSLATKHHIGQKVLVCDDELFIAQNICDLLNSRGFTTIMANNGLQALEHFNNIPFDLIILDIVLPDISGVALYHLLSSDASMPIIFQSGYHSEEELDTLLQHAHVEFIAKPYDTQQLLDKIHTVLALDVVSGGNND